MNCLNGFFHDVYTESLAETLTKAPDGGAVAVWASSTLTSFDQQGVLDQAFVERLTRTSLGEAAIAAKRAITDVDAQRTWILFGDPTLFGVPTPAAAPGDGGLGPDGVGDRRLAAGRRCGRRCGAAVDAGMPDTGHRQGDGGPGDGGPADGGPATAAGQMAARTRPPLAPPNEQRMRMRPARAGAAGRARALRPAGRRGAGGRRRPVPPRSSDRPGQPRLKVRGRDS